MNTETLSERLHTNTGLRIAAHFLFWTIMMAIGWYNTLISFNKYNRFDNVPILLLSLSGIIGQVLVYYPLVYFVLPQFFQKKRYLQGAGIVLLLILLYTFLNTISESLILLNCESCMRILKENGTGYYGFLQKSVSNRMLGKLLSFGIVYGLIFSISIPLSIKFALQAFRQQIQAVKLAKQNVELEFSFLKSQVNPHFLFNSLNNIYGLILRNDNQKAANVVARLAEFMRYSLYNSAEERMTVEKEVQLIKDYIELESIRMNHTKVNLSVEIDDYSASLPSLLLIPVIENAFKFCDDNTEAVIDIQLSIKNRQLSFHLSNTIDENRQLQQSGGIGLQNLNKRLALYYPNRHRYQVESSETSYSTILTIDL